MDAKKVLLGYGKKYITVGELAALLKIGTADVRELYMRLDELIGDGIIEPVKASGKNGNLTYPLYKKYHIIVDEAVDEVAAAKIKYLHPTLQKVGYLSSHPTVFSQNEEIIKALDKYLFSNNSQDYISRKERSYEIFGREKILDDSRVKALLKKLQITEDDLKFYDTPEYCFHDYIPVRKSRMTLLICENKDIWFNIRRCMFEDGFTGLFGTPIDGVVYGNGNKVSQKQGALAEYVRFMGKPEVGFLYWGDIDREGFDIFRRTRKVNPDLEISLFLPGYKKMLERASDVIPKDSPSSKKEGMTFDEELSVFEDKEKKVIKNLLAANKLIPQEIIPYTFLSER